MANETLNQRIKTLLSNDKTIDLNALYQSLAYKKFKLKLNLAHQLELYSEDLKQSISVDFNSSIIRNKIDPQKAKLPLIKAIEGRSYKALNILDGTAGLGSDCFVMASRGHIVTAVEQDVTIYLLLKDGLERAKLIINLENIAKRINLTHMNMEKYLSTYQHKFDIIYLDPMFPERKKSAKVKKNMQVLHEFLGRPLTEENHLFKLAKEKSKKLVIKRAALNDYLAQEKPSQFLKGKANRFDIYI